MDPFAAVQFPIRLGTVDWKAESHLSASTSSADPLPSPKQSREVPSITVTPAGSPKASMKGETGLVRNLSSLSLGPSSAEDMVLSGVPTPRATSQETDTEDLARGTSSVLPPWGLLCASKVCPIKESHNGGYYRYGGEDWRFEDENDVFYAERVFGRRNNPPPEIWGALERVIKGG